MKFIWFKIVIFVLFCSCNDKTERIKFNIEKMKEHSICLPLEKMQLYNKENIADDFSTKDYKLIIYVDSTKCSTCYLNTINRWCNTLDSLRKKSDKFASAFILSSSKQHIQDVKFKLEYLKFDHLIYLDSVGVFALSNPHIPTESMYHTFLLDKNNKIVFVGDPSRNQNVYIKLFKILENE